MTSPLTRRTLLSAAAAGGAAFTLAACAGEGAGGSAGSAAVASETATDASSTATPGAATAGAVNIDFATYNPLSLVVRERRYLEDAGLTVNWLQSAGSNRANEGLLSASLDIGSTAGSAALLARSNGSPIKVVSIYSQPEWAALVVPADSDIQSVGDLRGRNVAATLGTDPYFFLQQALAEAGLASTDVTLQNLQHADGRTALETGAVDAWSGLDPIMAAAESAGGRLFYRNIDFNSFGVLNAREEFIEENPEIVQLVVNAYETARAWALQNPAETAAILAEVAAIEPGVAEIVISERTNLDASHVPGDQLIDVLRPIGAIQVASGDVRSAEELDAALESLVEPRFASASTTL